MSTARAIAFGALLILGAAAPVRGAAPMAPACGTARVVAGLERLAAASEGPALRTVESAPSFGAERSTRTRNAAGRRSPDEQSSAAATRAALQISRERNGRDAQFVTCSRIGRAARTAWLTNLPPPVVQH